jgi:uncharacterized phage protein (TIGR02218 family)
MSFETQIAKREMEVFQELYEMTLGNTVKYYTSGLERVIWFGREYLPRPIKRGSFERTEKLNSVQVTITAPIDEMNRKYISNSPSEPIRIKIILVFLSNPDTEYYTIFDGEILDVTFQDNQANAIVESKTNVFRNKIPKILYQSYCNWTAFDTGCTLLEASYLVEAVVESKDKSDLVSSTFDAYDDVYFTGGHVRYDTDIRFITKHTGSTLSLQAPFDSKVAVGSTIKAYPGCDRSCDTCKNKFNNFSNFVGFPYIPNSNPTIWGIS